MKPTIRLLTITVVLATTACLVDEATAQAPLSRAERTAPGARRGPALSSDAIAEAQTPRAVNVERPEQRKGEQDAAARFSPTNAVRSSTALAKQPEQGEIRGFDFVRDPLNAKRPMETFEELMAADIAAKPGIMEAQRELLERRYVLEPKLDPDAKMSRGKPLPVGPTARLKEGLTWERLAAMSPADIRRDGSFPYPALPHPKHTPGGQVFPQMQIATRGIQSHR